MLNLLSFEKSEAHVTSNMFYGEDVSGETPSQLLAWRSGCLAGWRSDQQLSSVPFVHTPTMNPQPIILMDPGAFSQLSCSNPLSGKWLGWVTPG